MTTIRAGKRWPSMPGIKVEKIVYSKKAAISVGRSGVRMMCTITPATKRRLDRLARWGFGSRPKERANGVIYRSPWAFIRAVLRTRRIQRGER